MLCSKLKEFILNSIIDYILNCPLPPNKSYDHFLGEVARFFPVRDDLNFLNVEQHDTKFLINCLVNIENLRYIGVDFLKLYISECVDDQTDEYEKDVIAKLETYLTSHPDLIMGVVMHALKYDKSGKYTEVYDNIRILTKKYHPEYVFKNINEYTHPFWSSSPDYELIF